MNCMGQGAASSEIGGIRIADWALAVTYLLIALLFVIVLVAIIRTLLALWRGRSDEVLREEPEPRPRSDDGGLT